MYCSAVYGGINGEAGNLPEYTINMGIVYRSDNKYYISIVY